MQEAQTPHVDRAADRKLPGFWRQARWCWARAVARRCREPTAVFTDYLIFALTGAALGAISDRGRASLGKFSVEVRLRLFASTQKSVLCAFLPYSQ